MHDECRLKGSEQKRRQCTAWVTKSLSTVVISKRRKPGGRRSIKDYCMGNNKVRVTGSVAGSNNVFHDCEIGVPRVSMSET